MTRAMLASATVDLGASTTDVAFPPGTTVAGLLAMLRVDTADADIAVTLSDGRPAALSAAIGADLPSGVRLTVARGRASGEARARARRESTAARFAGYGAVASGFLLAGSLAVWVAWPAFTGAPVVQPLRVGAAVLAAIVVAVVGFAGRTVAHPAGALAVPGLLGALATAVLDPGWPSAATLALPVAGTVAALVATGRWLTAGGGVAAAAAVLWGATAALVLTAALLGATRPELAAVVLCLGVAALALAPRLALPVPESQLLDLPLVTTSAPAVRAPDVPAPARITGRRVTGTLTYATGATETGALGGVGLVVAGGVLLVPSARLDTLPGQAGLAALAAAALVLLLLPRSHRSPLVRIVPRIGALVLGAATAIGLTMQGSTAAVAAAAALIVAAGIAVLIGVRLVRAPSSAMLIRAADVLQGAALALLVPAALYASGLFDLVWQVAS